MYRANKDKPLSKKQERTNRRIREELLINPNDTIYKGVVDNMSNTHINISQRLIDKGFVPNDINNFARKVVVKTELCVMEISHPHTNKYVALVMGIGRKLKKLYKEYNKRNPNLVNTKGHYKNNYNVFFYDNYGDNLLYSYKPKFEEFDYSAMRDFYNDRKDKKGWYDYRLIKK